MLAYLFWHRPRQAVGRADYEQALAHFHGALADAAPSGFVRSGSWRVDLAPWVAQADGDGHDVYEDWYLLEDTGSLDVLERAAVHGSLRTVHASAAWRAGGAVAGLYRLVAGEPVTAAPSGTWLDVRPGVDRRLLGQLLGAIADRSGSSVWMRRLTLSPAPELDVLGDLPDLGDLPEMVSVRYRQQRVAVT